MDFCSFKIDYFDHAVHPYMSKKRQTILKNAALDNLIWEMFKQCKPVEGNEEIVVLGHIKRDGQGDWLAMTNACKHLQKKFPNRTVRLIASSARNHEGKLPSSNIKNCNVIYSDNLSATKSSEFPEEMHILEKIQNAALIFVGPIDLWHLREEAGNMDHKAIAFNEYDARTNLSSLPNRITTGVAKESVGIFTKSLGKKKEWTWSSIENNFLKGILFGSANPEESKINEYLLKNIIFFSYMSVKTFPQFISDAILFAKINDPTKSIDICFPCKGKLENIVDVLPYKKLISLGIRKISFINYVGDNQIEKQDLELATSGQVLRIFNPGPLSLRDFKKMIFLSAGLVGVTGDNSIAQALSFGKIPFYECPIHKRNFAEKLASLIEEHCKQDGTPLANYIRAVMQKEETELLISDSSLKEVAKKVGKIIQQEFSVNAMFPAIANHQLFVVSNPEYALLEASLRQDYLESKITLKEFEKRLVATLTELGMLLPTTV